MRKQNVDNHTFNILSICSGVGGLELGLKLAVPNARVVAYVEGEAYACAILAKRMEERSLDCAPVWTDLRTFDGKAFRGKVDCIAGGYPCQPFSAAGNKLGAADPRHLWPAVSALVRDIRPPVCFFENVRGHLSLGFEQVANDLQRMGYAVKAGLFSAAEIGAPHNRERLFILAYDSRKLRQRSKRSGTRSGRPEETIGGRSTILADADGKRRNGRNGRICAGAEQAAEPAEPGGNALSLWPPMPNDHEGWSKVSAHLKPAVLRMADGLADRVDRIRACGNGVVPLVAAYAWRTLTAGMQLEWNKQ